MPQKVKELFGAFVYMIRTVVVVFMVVVDYVKNTI